MEDKLEKYGVLFDNISDLAYICDTEGNVLFLNKVFERLSGHKPAEFIGNSFAPLFEGEDLKKAIDLYSRTLNGESLQQEVCFKDTGIFCEYKNKPLRDEKGGIIGVIGTARDITERKRLEVEIKEINKSLEQRVTDRTGELVKINEELVLFRNLIGQSNDAIFIVGTGTIHFLDVNDKACESLGYKRKELLNMKVEDIDVMPKQIFLENLEKLKKNEYLTLVSEHKRKDGTTFPVEINIKIVTFKEKSYMIAVARDITERKRAEETLRKSEEKYSRLIGNLQENYFFYSHNVEGIFTYISPSITNMLGYTPEEFLTHYSEYMTDNPNNREVIKHTDLSISGIKQPPYEVEVYHKDGSIRTLKVQEVPVFDKNHNVIAVEGIAEEITILKQSQEQLRKLSSVVEQSPVTVLITDTEGNIKYTNPKFTQLTGYISEEVIGKTPRILKSGKTSPETYTQLWKNIKSGVEWHGELCNRKKNGELYWELVFISPIRNTEDIITHFVAVKEDITERKQAEEKFATYQTQLKRLSSALSLTEERERRHISEGLHDKIGQSLTVIKMKLEELQEPQTDTDTDSVLNETWKLLDKTIKDLRTLTFEISPPILYELGFEPAVEWLVEQFKGQHNISIDFVNHGLNIKLNDDVCFFLFKAVRELLFNIVKHAQADRIKVIVLTKNNKIRVNIEDDGVGFIVSKVRFSVNELNGFGLFSIRERMGHFDGKFDIKSKPGQGTRITLVMPLKQQIGVACAKR